MTNFSSSRSPSPSSPPSVSTLSSSPSASPLPSPPSSLSASPLPSPPSVSPALLAEFTFEIRETLVTCITVEAENVEEAYHEVRRQYKRGDIILDAEAFLDYEITFLE